jgi:hypothetical protein
MKNFNHSWFELVVLLMVCLFPTACTSRTLIPVVLAESLLDTKYGTVGRVKATCSKKKCKDVSAESCTRKIQIMAARMNADALIIDPPVLVQSGIHEGLEIIAVECAGRAIKWANAP